MSAIAKSSYDIMDEIVLPMRQCVLDTHNRSVAEQQHQPSVFAFDAETQYAPDDDGLFAPWSKPVKFYAPEDEYDMPPALHYLSKPLTMPV